MPEDSWGWGTPSVTCPQVSRQEFSSALIQRPSLSVCPTKEVVYDPARPGYARPDPSRDQHRPLFAGSPWHFMLRVAFVVDKRGCLPGMIDFGDLWLAPILAVLAYLAADFLSGFVHFLADNFGSYDTPIIGPNFIEPFREHHVDPKGIVGNDFVDANGNNSLASLPFMLGVWVIVP